jgi:hypothetical protein
LAKSSFTPGIAPLLAPTSTYAYASKRSALFFPKLVLLQLAFQKEV